MPAVAATLSASDVGSTATILYSGTTPNGNNSADLTATQTIKLESFTAGTNVFSFSYTMTNTSSGVVTGSRLVGFGFDTAPELVQAGSLANPADLFGSTGFTQSISGGVNVDFCVSTNNCSGGGGTGVTKGNSTSGTFTLNFADGAIAPVVTVDEFTARFQDIVAVGFANSGIAGGNPGGGFINPTVGAVPVPGAVWLFGSGIAGLGMLRLRRRKQQQQLAA
jgi:hypothetical protein